MEMQAQAQNENAAENEQDAMEEGGEVGPQSIDVLQVRQFVQCAGQFTTHDSLVRCIDAI